MSTMYKIENAKNNKKLIGDTLTVSRVKKTDGKGPTLREIMLDVQKDIKDLQTWKKTVDTLLKSHGWTK